MVIRDPTTTVQLKFRVRESLRARLDDAADKHGLTLTAEITRRLEESFEIDNLRRELEAQRETVLRSLVAIQEQAAEERKRNNQLTDLLLQITSKDLKLVRREEPK